MRSVYHEIFARMIVAYDLRFALKLLYQHSWILDEREVLKNSGKRVLPRKEVCEPHTPAFLPMRAC